MLRWLIVVAAQSHTHTHNITHRFTKMRKDLFGDEDAFYNSEKPKFRFKRDDNASA